MNKLFAPLSFIMVIAFLITACIPPVVDVAQAAPAEVSYQAILGKPASDKSVADFIASNKCVPSGSFELCSGAGLALWMDDRRVVKAAYLYAHEFNGFSAYKGDLPFGLEPDDTRADAELKLGHPLVEYGPQAGWELGKPDTGSSPDHMYFWATYKRFGMTIVYDSPSADDQNANIHAILISQ